MKRNDNNVIKDDELGSPVPTKEKAKSVSCAKQQSGRVNVTDRPVK